MSYELGTCGPDELEELGALADRIFRTERPGDMVREYPLLFDPANRRNLRVARNGGRIVAHVGVVLRDAAILGTNLRVALIGSVGTDPEHRGQGLASRLMAEARASAVEQGACLMLISGDRGLYKRLGYVQVGAFDSYSVPAGKPDPAYQSSHYAGADLAAVASLYQAEPVRFFRPMEDWRRLMEGGMLMNRPADLFVIRWGGAVVAYAGVQRPAQGAEGSGEPLHVREIAGSRRALSRALPSLVRDLGAEAADVVVQPNDSDWRQVAQSRGWASSRFLYSATMGIISPERFLTAVRPLLEELAAQQLRIVPEGEGVRLEWGSETVSLPTMAQATTLFFSTASDTGVEMPPLPSGIRDVLANALPLPNLWYGYNYV